MTVVTSVELEPPNADIAATSETIAIRTTSADPFRNMLKKPSCVRNSRDLTALQLRRTSSEPGQSRSIRGCGSDYRARIDPAQLHTQIGALLHGRGIAGDDASNDPNRARALARPGREGDRDLPLAALADRDGPQRHHRRPADAAGAAVRAPRRGARARAASPGPDRRARRRPAGAALRGRGDRRRGARPGRAAHDAGAACDVRAARAHAGLHPAGRTSSSRT